MKYILLVLVLFLISCATPFQEVERKTLVTLEKDIPSIYLNSDYRFDAKPSLGRLMLTLKSGEYIPFATDGSGTYFFGPEKCLELNGENVKDGAKINCGIYQTNDESEVWHSFEFVVKSDVVVGPNHDWALFMFGPTGYLVSNLMQKDPTKKLTIRTNVVLDKSKMDYTIGLPR